MDRFGGGKLMADEFQLSLLKRVSVWNEWRRENQRNQVDLSEADLSGADLLQVKLQSAMLSKANLQGRS